MRCARWTASSCSFSCTDSLLNIQADGTTYFASRVAVAGLTESGTIGDYAQPLPRPSPPMVEQIRRIAADLNADKYQVRERAQAQILSLGPSALSVLRQVVRTAPPEAQRRIEVITQHLLRQLETTGGQTGPTTDFGSAMINGEFVPMPNGLILH